MTLSGPAHPCRNWDRNAAEVPELLLPSSSIHSTSPLSTLQAHRRVIAGLLAVTRAGRVHQSRFSSQHPLAPKFGVRPEVGPVGRENPGPGPPRLLRQGGVLRHEGLPLGPISLEQTLLGPLEGKPQTVQVVQATAAAQDDAEPLQDNVNDGGKVGRAGGGLLSIGCRSSA